MIDQTTAVEDRVNGAGRGDLYGMWQFAQQAFANLSRSPVWLLAFRRNDRGFNLRGKLIGVAERAARPICQTFQAALFITLKDLVSRLSRDPEFAAERSHALAVLQANDKTHSFVHYRTLLPWHGPYPPLGDKV